MEMALLGNMALFLVGFAVEMGCGAEQATTICMA